MKLGILVSCPPAHRNFGHGIGLAGAALKRGLQVYLYCIDDAVTGIASGDLQSLKSSGLVLYGCAFSARCRNVPINDLAAFTGLTIVSDLIAGTDRFVSLNS